MTVVFAGREPSKQELERLRLLLSTYQDGTGMLNLKKAPTSLPGWRDFERGVALAFNGQAQESKAVFDVLLHDPERDVDYGISCKMRMLLKDAEKKRQVTIETSNSARYFWTALAEHGIKQDNYTEFPADTGTILVNLVESWHRGKSVEKGGTVDLSKSCYLVLQWDFKSGRYKLFKYKLNLFDPAALDWKPDGKRIVGRDSKNKIMVEWYGESGGQLKYYPYWDDNLWESDVFSLEPLPNDRDDYGIKRKAAAYFPERWQWATSG
jgi:hypothetical protein